AGEPEEVDSAEDEQGGNRDAQRAEPEKEAGFPFRPQQGIDRQYPERDLHRREQEERHRGEVGGGEEERHHGRAEEPCARRRGKEDRGQATDGFTERRGGLGRRL